MKKFYILLLLMTLTFAGIGSAYAISDFLTDFNSTYGTSGTALDSCSVCHTRISERNSYGSDWKENGENFRTIESLDSDNDGFTNIEEINARTFPGVAASQPPQPEGDCGDGFIDAGEECDDGNNIDGDGCSAVCSIDRAFPDIKANSSDGPVIISQSDILSVTGQLNAGSMSGQDADWWVVANTPFSPPNDWYYFDLDSGWMPGMTVTYQGPLFNIGPYEVLNISGLPLGTYTLYFGVDMDMNSSLDLDQAYYDSVQVTIEP